MDYGKKSVRTISRCLECGDRIAYGRTDKKFCSEECKNRHHNHLTQSGRMAKRKTIAVLENNYRILDDLFRSGITAVWLSDIILEGFNPSYVTCFHKGRKYCQYSCFDIHYTMTANRISSISKIQNLSVTLQDCLKEEV